MTIDPDVYRGFRLNLEMAGGKFIPAYHDPLNLKHANDRWSRLPEAADTSKQEAERKAHAAIDKMVLSEIAHTIGQMHDAGVKVAI